MFKGYRTMIVNGLAMILPVLSLSEWYQILPAEWLPWYGLGLAVINMYLRSVTTTPVGKKS